MDPKKLTSADAAWIMSRACGSGAQRSAVIVARAAAPGVAEARGLFALQSDERNVVAIGLELQPYVAARGAVGGSDFRRQFSATLRFHLRIQCGRYANHDAANDLAARLVRVYMAERMFDA